MMNKTIQIETGIKEIDAIEILDFSGKHLRDIDAACTVERSIFLKRGKTLFVYGCVKPGYLYHFRCWQVKTIVEAMYLLGMIEEASREKFHKKLDFSKRREITTEARINLKRQAKEMGYKLVKEKRKAKPRRKIRA